MSAPVLPGGRTTLGERCSELATVNVNTNGVSMHDHPCSDTRSFCTKSGPCSNTIAVAMRAVPVSMSVCMLFLGGLADCICTAACTTATVETNLPDRLSRTTSAYYPEVCRVQRDETRPHCCRTNELPGSLHRTVVFAGRHTVVGNRAFFDQHPDDILPTPMLRSERVMRSQ